MDKESHRRGSAPVLSLLVVFAIIAGLIAAIIIVRRQSYTPSKASAAALPTSVNFLTNGNFEDRLSAWTRVGKGDYDFIKLNRNGKNTTALKLKAKEGGFGISQRITVSADVPYNFTGYFQKDPNVIPTLQIRVMGKNPVNWVGPIGLSNNPDANGWRTITTADVIFSLKDYAASYNNAAGGFVIEVSLNVPQAGKEIVLDDLRFTVAKDTVNIIQNPSFEAWKTGNSIYAWDLHKGKVVKSDGAADGGAAAVELSATGSAKFAYLDQEITKLVVKGGDYDLSAFIKGDAGWIGISEQLDQGGVRWGFARPVLALDEAMGDSNAPIPADRFRCFDVDENNIKSCRFYLRSRASWEKVSRLFHVDDNAVKVWVNLAVQNPGNVQTKLNFDNVSLVYHQAQASAAPALVSPANGAIINDTTPTLTWQRLSGFGNNKVVGYTVEVSKANTTKADGSFTSTLESITRDFTARTVRLEGNGQFFWHVQAVNDSNQKSPWSETWSFTVDTKRPSRVTKLTTTPKLGDNLGTANLQVTWPNAADPNFDHYEASVIHDNSAPVTGGAKQALSSPQTTFNLSGLTNDDYVVIVYAVDKAGNKSRTAARFGYFEDGFSGNSLSAGWERMVGPDSKVTQTSGYISAEDLGKRSTESWARIMHSFNASNAFAVSVESMSTTVNPLRGLVFVGLVVEGPGGINGIGRFIASLDNKSDIGQVSWSGAGPDWTQSGMPSPVALNSPISFSLTYDGTTWTTYYNGQFLSSSSSMWPDLKDATKVGVGVLSSKPNFPPISASFDNFRLIFVK